ncbi:hypothetical protein MRB53_006798 [Persea americana]|uniref:Uncharacterized protein n=1 Tax=Persea americana TaxID=3435 RepID=A0ACC2MI01_PERAE|nr:hypothetical protein MRB53_006798 [Persea americana]
MAFSSSMRFFSDGFSGTTFLFSARIHLKSSRCSSAGMGCRIFRGSAVGRTGVVFSRAVGGVFSGTIAAAFTIGAGVCSSTVTLSSS